ncbi:MAG: histidine phosphatase family protein [Acidimicrobiia bacterium]|nr:histidine phosphatase family protein [Acidimicrobiia bacterium]MYC44567.1 histidine phosphatase family protein [Acidimicrobiia bacterium]MYI19178.1 histidine phosphatase family protein [Acidimicrobiia bacterium]
MLSHATPAACVTPLLLGPVGADRPVPYGHVKLLLIRHALPERVENAEGPADPGLTGVGREQARRLAAWLAAEEIDHVAASPKLRAVETAEPLAIQRGLEIETVQGFAEIDSGSTTYIPYEQMRRERHEIWRHLRSGRWQEAGFADPELFRDDVAKTFAAWEADHTDQTVAVVAHSGTINALVSHVLGIENVFFFSLEYTGLCRLRRNLLGGMHVTSLNETAHLHAERDSLGPLPPP